MSTRSIIAHRKQVVRQILLPFAGGIVLIGLVAVGAGWAGLGSYGVWADIALVWLIVLLMLVGILALAVLTAAVAASVWLLRWLPPQTARVQSFVGRVPAGVARGADAVVRPVIVVRSIGRAMARLWGR